MFKLSFILAFSLIAASGCGSKFLKHDRESQLKNIDEFDQRVKIDIPAEVEDVEAPTSDAKQAEVSQPDPKPTPTPSARPTPPKRVAAKPTPSPKAKAAVKVGTAVAKASARRQPELESDIGFDGRRPIQDPFRVGEKVVHEVHYFSISAGTMNIEVKPFAQVNSRKNYHFHIGIKTSRWYSGIYSVDDKVSVLMDFETLVPSVFQLHVRESGQLKEARMLFEGNKAMYWEKKITEKHGEEEKKKDWDILDYSQNVFSAVYYMRAFHWEVGKENAFRVADDGENLIFRGKAIRKEKISTDAGEFDAIVVQPQIELKGKFKPVGDIFVWLSDDDRKFILKIESKIKIGTLVSEVIELKP